MNIIIISKTTFNSVELDDVKNISFDSTSFTVTKSDNSTVTYAKADYLLSIKW